MLINVLPPDDGPSSEYRRQAQIFRRIGSRIMPGFTLASPSDELDFLLDLIEDYDLLRIIRLGLANPILGGMNHSLHPRHYPIVGQLVADFAQRSVAARSFTAVRVRLRLGTLHVTGGVSVGIPESKPAIGQYCFPILDILPDGRVISCYGLAHHHQESLRATHDASWLRRFAQQQETDRLSWLYPACADCHRRRDGQCTGGCLAQRMAVRETVSAPLSRRRASASLRTESS